MKNIYVENLAKLPFLQGINAEVIQRLIDEASEAHYQPGEDIIREGSVGRELFLVVDGLIAVIKGQGDQEIQITRSGPGEVLGEMGFIDERPRSATVRAVQPTRVLVLSAERMRAALSEHPSLLFRTMQMLSARLRQTDQQMIEDLHRKNLELAQAYQELQAAQAALLEKERIERELELARDLQQSILPRQFPQIPGLHIAAINQPARQVGGDFYDVIPLKNGRLGLVIADVSGKGMPAALFMGLTRSLIRAEARRSLSPRTVLLSVNNLLMENQLAEMFVTVFYGVLDPQESQLSYVRAGHDRPILYNSERKECRWLAPAGTVLGMLADIRLDEERIRLQPGEQLVLYSDGITDANSPSGEFFGAERLQKIICFSKASHPRELCQAIFDQVGQFQAGAEQYDDMTLLIVHCSAIDRSDIHEPV
jgi:serine phosphatase RsbU (regulator of sigma subunit)